ncbi:MAG TPA: extracellular solute-binding protein [Acidimicrobiales bacterium]|nr:extracellular solute-binding protein [Acidimicrobiales bacterium]
MPRNRPHKLTKTVALSLAGALAAASSGGAAASAQTSRDVHAAKVSATINVAIAYPAPPAKMLAAFTAQTGIKVNYSYIQWDNLQTKIAAAAEANTYFADVADVDWSKVGEYYESKWFMPLNKYFNVGALAPQYPQLASFVRNGELLGMPSDISLLVTTVNTKDFAKAGITKMPATLPEYTSDLNALKAKGVVSSPLDIPFAAAEGLSTYWYETTAAFGGQVLSSSYKPMFTSPGSAGYKAMEWMVSAYKSGLVPKGNLDLEDYQGFSQDEAHNLTASVFSDYSGDLGTIYDVPSDSTVVGDVAYIPTPGVNGPAPNLANPDGIGIPKQAKDVSAAVTFIKWYDEPANQAAFAGADGAPDVINGFPLPANVGGLNALVSSGKVPGAAELASLAEHHSRAIFPAGAPPWYPAFSNAVYTNLHSAASGQESVSSAIKNIASQVASLEG